MDLVAEHFSRHQQLTDIQGNLPHLYTQLLFKFEIQKKELIEFKTKAHYWESQFSKFKSRENELKTEIEELKAQLRKRDQQLFGKKSEKGISRPEKITQAKSKNKRGQQPGSKGHGRRDYSHLTSVDETVCLTENDSFCSCCGLAYEELSATEDSEVLEVINVKPYRRLIRRKKYKRCCTCAKNTDPQILSAPPSERLYPKSRIGISIWAFLLLNKYKYQHPIYRVLEQLKGHGLSLSTGTIIDGIKKLLPLFVPVYDAIVKRSVAAKHWHADETGWKVYEEIEGKNTNRWYLWIFHNEETVVFKIDPSRSSKVLFEHFGKDHDGGILNVDRYSAYKVIAKLGLFILAFCWAHVRRDFLNYSKEYPHKEDWGLEWVERINHLYHINNQRIQFESSSEKFIHYNQELKQSLEGMRKQLEIELEDPNLLPSAKKRLKSLNNHWSGLTVFVEHPEIPMDNNTAERGLRGPVVGRKGYYGSQAVWSAELAAALFTIFGTIKLAGLNEHTWLLAYLQECAILGGNPPTDVNKYLPWNMTEYQKELFSCPPVYESSA
jgi:transposase